MGLNFLKPDKEYPPAPAPVATAEAHPPGSASSVVPSTSARSGEHRWLEFRCQGHRLLVRADHVHDPLLRDYHGTRPPYTGLIPEQRQATERWPQLPPAVACPHCGYADFWLTVYDEDGAQPRCVNCEPAPSPSVQGARLYVAGGEWRET